MVGGTRTPRTKHESLKEKVDPAHDDHLGHHHHKLLLHAVHHAFHLRRVCQRVGRSRWLFVWFGRTVFEECSCCECLGEVLRDGFVRRGREGRVG